MNEDTTTHDEKLRQQHEYGKMETMTTRESAKFAFRRPPYCVMVEEVETDKDQEDKNCQTLDFTIWIVWME